MTQPAFPTNTGLGNHQAEGMTLRDYFAAKAMQSILSLCEDNGDEPFWNVIAPDAYKMADEMLKARDGNS